MKEAIRQSNVTKMEKMITSDGIDVNAVISDSYVSSTITSYL